MQSDFLQHLDPPRHLNRCNPVDSHLFVGKLFPLIWCWAVAVEGERTVGFWLFGWAEFGGEGFLGK